MTLRHFRSLFFISIFFTVFLFIYACNSKYQYPQELVMADSAYMQGDYSLADELLESITRKNELADEASRMYYQLLKLEQANMHGKITDSLFSIADSLCRYYQENGSLEELAKATYFLGAIYHVNKDYPSAIQHYLKANELSVKCNDRRLECLLARGVGDVYLEQQLLNECVPFYRKYYDLAVSNHDTLRMAYATGKMAMVCTINQDVDSIIYYYKESIKLGKRIPQGKDIVPVSMSNLCDIYIQTAQYEKALEVMPRDSINDGNWAYWHYGQQHVDSAICYFQKTLGRYKWWGETEVLRILAQLEEQRGDLQASLDYYKQLAVAEDSLRVQQRAEATMRTEAQFNYTSIQQERDRLEKRNAELKHLLWLASVIVAALVVVALLLWRFYKQKRRAVEAKQELLENEREEQLRQSRQQMDENQRLLATLQQQLHEARQQNDQATTERLQMEADVLTTQNQNIEARQRRKEALLLEMKRSALYQRLKAPAREGQKRMTEAEWHQLARHLDGIYELTPRLLSLAKLSENELRVCYLLKIGMPPAEIADVMCKSKSAVTLARQRMFYKLAGRKGKAEALDELISDF